MNQKINTQNVEANNDKNSLKNLSTNEFFLMREAVIKKCNRMKDENKRKEFANAWLKIERAWYESLEEGVN